MIICTLVLKAGTYFPMDIPLRQVILVGS